MILRFVIVLNETLQDLATVIAYAAVVGLLIDAIQYSDAYTSNACLLIYALSPPIGVLVLIVATTIIEVVTRSDIPRRSSLKTYDGA